MTCFITSECIGCLACARICPTGAATGEKKERHTINPEACIDCGACGRVCPSRAVEDSFGLIIERVPKKRWLMPEIDLDSCASCGVCLDTCPVAALESKMAKKGSLHLFPYLPDPAACIACGFCAQDCPLDAITMVSRESVQKSLKKETEEA